MDQAEPVEPGDQAMKALLDGVQMVAREEDAEIEALSKKADHPLSQGIRDRIAGQILEARSQGARAPGDASSFAPIGETRAARSATKPRWSAQRRRFVSLMGAGGIVAAAAALALWARPSSQDLVLPAYTVTASGGVRAERGATPPPGTDDTTAALQRVRPDSELVVAVRPETNVAGTVAARAFLVQGPEIVEVRAQTQIAPSGAVELRLRGADLEGPRRGHALLRILVGRPGVIASAASPAIESGAAGPGLRVLTVPVDLEGP